MTIEEMTTKIGIVTKNIKRTSKKGNKYTVLKISLENKDFEFVGFMPMFNELIDNNFIVGDFIKIIGTTIVSTSGMDSNFKAETLYRLKKEDKMLATWDNLSTQKWALCETDSPLSDEDYVKTQEEINKNDKLSYNKDARVEAWQNFLIDEIRGYHNDVLKDLPDTDKIDAKTDYSFIKEKAYANTLLNKKTILSEGVFTKEEEELVKTELRKKQNHLNKLAKSYLYVYKLRNANNSHSEIKKYAELERVRRKKELIEIYGQEYDFVNYLVNNDKTEDISILSTKIISIVAEDKKADIEVMIDEAVKKISFQEEGFFYIADNELKKGDEVNLIIKKRDADIIGLFISKK